MINIFGTTSNSSGYANHCKGLLKGLYENNTEYCFRSFENKPLSTLKDYELKGIKTEIFKTGITIAVSMPHSWKLVKSITPKAKLYGCLVWEGDKLPLWMKEYLKIPDAIIVPSSHVMNALVNTFPEFAEKTFILSHGVDSKLFKPQEKETEKFVFVANKGWREGVNDRGGMSCLIKAYCEEFNKNDNVQLRIKINPAYGGDYNLFLKELNIKKDHPEILINANNMSEEEMPKIYAGDVFVSPSKAEGFSLPCLEALSSGIPVITTGYGGQTDYVINGLNGWLINYELFEVVHDFAYEGIRWAEPDFNTLKKLLRYVYENQNIVKQYQLVCRESIKSLQWKNIILNLLKEIKRRKHDMA